MNAIILAAGRGSRMKHETAANPKCLVKLEEKTLLDWQLSALMQGGVQRVTVIGGYLSDLIRKGKYDFLENKDWAETNMVATLFCADPLLQKEPAIVSYSDIVYHPSHIQMLGNSSAAITVLYDRQWKSLWEARFQNPLTDAETFRQKNGRLLEIGSRPATLEEVEGQFMGLFKISPTGWMEIRDTIAQLPKSVFSRLDMTGLLQKLLAKQVRIDVIAVDGKWCEVDSSEDRLLYESKLKTQWPHDWRF